jgi:ankyrin repeat protein
MKRIRSHVALLGLLMALYSCGKKPEVNENQKDLTPPTSAQVYFKALKELRTALFSNDHRTFKRVISENPQIDLNQNDFGETGDTLLIIAIKKDYRNIRNFLIEKGAQLERAGVNKETPLIAAVNNARANSVKVLIDLKVDLEKRDNTGDTALHIALKKSLDEIAVDLIQAGANITSIDSTDRDALRLAELNNTPDALEHIKKLKDNEFGTPSLTSFKNVLIEADHKRLHSILNKFPKIAVDKNYQSINPLALLVDSANEKSALTSAELLIRFNANVNGPEDAEMTPLIKATVRKKAGFADLYLSSNANPQLLDKDGKSALIHAVENNNFELVQLLLSYSAAEKYTFRKNGKKITLSACDSAKETEKKLTSKQEKEINEKIRRVLDCYIFRRSSL